MLLKNKGDYKDVEKAEEEEDNDNGKENDEIEEMDARESQLPTRCCRRCGITLQVLLFLFNGAAWVLAVLAITGGLIVGFGTQTININFEIADLMVATPATLFITYGFALLLVTGCGCFAAASANMFHNICYLVLIILFVIFDLVFGFWLLLSPISLINFVNHLRKSMDGYGKTKTSPVGIFPLTPTFYWNHLQKRGKCCGLYKYNEWKNVSIGKEQKGIPDSCCNLEYDHRFCGDRVWQHPDMKGHGIENMLNTEGCLTIFPPTLIHSFEEITYMGLILGALLLACLIIVIIIIIIICTRRYDPGQGIANYQLREVSKNISALDIEEYDGYGKKNRYILEKRGNRKVHPSNEDVEAGDVNNKGRRKLSNEDAKAGDVNNKGRRKVNFLESGPQFIPSQHFVNSDDEHNFPTAPSRALPRNDYDNIYNKRDVKGRLDLKKK